MCVLCVYLYSISTCLVHVCIYLVHIRKSYVFSTYLSVWVYVLYKYLYSCIILVFIPENNFFRKWGIFVINHKSRGFNEISNFSWAYGVINKSYVAEHDF